MAIDRIWIDHRDAALATFFATPVAGLAQVFIAEPLAAGQNPIALVYQMTVWLMMFSVIISWGVLLAAVPLAVFLDRRFGPTYWLAVPMGCVVAVLVFWSLEGRITVDQATIPVMLTGAVMAAIYCAALRWFRTGPV